MTTPLNKILGSDRLHCLSSNGIEVIPPLLQAEIFLYDTEVKVTVPYRKPKKNECKDYYVSQVLERFNDIEIALSSLVEELQDKYPLLSESDIVRELSVDKNPTHVHLRSMKKLEVCNMGAIDSRLSEMSLIQEFRHQDKIRDYPEVFPLARGKKRKIVALLGDTNSGKTWTAMSMIADSFSSAYLAPLRLLAQETFEYLNHQGIPTSLITGEEKIINDGAMCVSSTVECFNSSGVYDTVVIDEIQMIDDYDRGAFFVQALVGSNANTVIVTGPKEYESRIKEITDYLGEDLEVQYFERKSKLQPLKKHTPLHEVKPNTAIIGFSKKSLYEIQKSLPKHIRSTLLYGALGYEVRKKQAERFINGEVDVIISTDCIGMGLNLPIETVLFTDHEKYNGYVVDDIGVMLAKQISGRAGRFGKFDTGYYGATDRHTLSEIKSMTNTKLRSNRGKFQVLPPKNYITSLLAKYNLSDILSGWADTFKFPEESIFSTDSLSRQIDVSMFLERHFPEEVKNYWNLIYCPIDLSKQEMEFYDACKGLISRGKVRVPVPNPQVMSQGDLELILRELNMLMWFGHTFEDCIMDDKGIDAIRENIQNVNQELNRRLEKKV